MGNEWLTKQTLTVGDWLSRSIFGWRCSSRTFLVSVGFVFRLHSFTAPLLHPPTKTLTKQPRGRPERAVASFHQPRVSAGSGPLGHLVRLPVVPVVGEVQVVQGEAAFADDVPGSRVHVLYVRPRAVPDPLRASGVVHVRGAFSMFSNLWFAL